MKRSIGFPLLVILASSCYGTLSTIVKLAMGAGFTASEAVTSQYYIGFLLSLLLLLAVRRRIPPLRGWKTILLCGLLTSTTGIVYGQAMNYLPASLAVVMLFQFTWIGTLMHCIANRRLPTRPEVVSLALLFAGTLLAAGVLDVDLSGIQWQGWALGFAAAVSFSLFVNVNGMQVEGLDALTRMFYVSLFSLILITLFQAPHIVWDGKLFGSSLLLYGLLLGLLGIVIPISLFSIAVPKVGGAMASILSATELPVAVTVSVLLLHEQLTLLQVLGIGVILLGMTIPTLADLRRAKKRDAFSTPPV